MSNVLILAKGVLGDRAISDLRKAGYIVVTSEQPEQVRLFSPETIRAASDRAKIKAFEYHIGSGPFSATKNDMRESYIDFLKQEKAF